MTSSASSYPSVGSGATTKGGRSTATRPEGQAQCTAPQAWPAHHQELPIAPAGQLVACVVAQTQ
eukprot:416558-Prorocentrum_lima.AAC.1